MAPQVEYFHCGVSFVVYINAVNILASRGPSLAKQNYPFGKYCKI